MSYYVISDIKESETNSVTSLSIHSDAYLPVTYFELIGPSSLCILATNLWHNLYNVSLVYMLKMGVIWLMLQLKIFKLISIWLTVLYRQ